MATSLTARPSPTISTAKLGSTTDAWAPISNTALNIPTRPKSSSTTTPSPPSGPSPKPSSSSSPAIYNPKPSNASPPPPSSSPPPATNSSSSTTPSNPACPPSPNSNPIPANFAPPSDTSRLGPKFWRKLGCPTYRFRMWGFTPQCPGPFNTWFGFVFALEVSAGAPVCRCFRWVQLIKIEGHKARSQLPLFSHPFPKSNFSPLRLHAAIIPPDLRLSPDLHLYRSAGGKRNDPRAHRQFPT